MIFYLRIYRVRHTTCPSPDAGLRCAPVRAQRGGALAGPTFPHRHGSENVLKAHLQESMSVRGRGQRTLMLLGEDCLTGGWGNPDNNNNKP